MNPIQTLEGRVKTRLPMLRTIVEMDETGQWSLELYGPSSTGNGLHWLYVLWGADGEFTVGRILPPGIDEDECWVLSIHSRGRALTVPDLDMESVVRFVEQQFGVPGLWMDPRPNVSARDRPN